MAEENVVRPVSLSEVKSILKKIDISMNPIEKFDIYMVGIYNALNLGPKNWFPKTELKRLKKQIKRMKGTSSVEKYSSKEIFTKLFLYFTIWAVLTFLLALVINLAFWGALFSPSGREYWEVLFSVGLWTFVVGGIGAVFVMIIFYAEVVF